MTQWLRVTEIARLTNLSRRYWQRCFVRGDVPGARQVRFGRRRLFLADRRQFEAWWAQRMLVISSTDTLGEIESAASVRAPEEQASVATTAPTRPSFAAGSTRRATRSGRPLLTRASKQRCDPRQKAFAFDERESDQQPGTDSP